MEIDPNGKIVDKKIFESVIRSRKQMTYKNVNKILEENIIPEGYEEYVPYLRMMKDLAKILRTEKINRGYIEFDIDEDGTPLDKERMPIVGDLKVALPEGASFLTRNLIMNFQGLRFDKVGTYAINITLDGELVASTPLRLVMVQGEQA